jgi:guanylate kinase
MLPALRGRAQQGTLTPASLEQLITLLTGGQQDSTAALVTRFETAQRELAAVMLAQETP